MKKALVAFIVIVVLALSTFTSFAAPDPNVVLVNPAEYSTVHSDNLLISVKVLQPKTIRIKVFEERHIVSSTTTTAINIATFGAISQMDPDTVKDVQIGTADTYTCTNKLSFYTKQINDLKPGLYMIQIETLDKDGKAMMTKESYVIMKEKATDVTGSAIFNTQQTGTMQLLQNLLKSLFGN